MYLPIGIVLVVMVVTYIIAKTKKLSVELSMLSSAVAGGLAGAVVGTPPDQSIGPALGRRKLHLPGCYPRFYNSHNIYGHHIRIGWRELCSQRNYQKLLQQAYGSPDSAR